MKIEAQLYNIVARRKLKRRAEGEEGLNYKTLLKAYLLI